MDLSIIIVHWNTRPDLLRCLSSLSREKGAVRLETIVVDNASIDGAVDAVRASHPDVRCVGLDCNVGFAAGNNAGIEVASGRYVLFLNPDTVVQPGGVEGAVNWMDDHPEAGAAGCLLRDGDGVVERSFGRFPSLSVNAGHAWSRLFGRKVGPRPESFTEPIAVDWVTGAFLIVRRETLEKGVRFDPGYPLYFEDVDFCRQLRDAGLRVYFVPEPWVLHLRGRAPLGRARRAWRRFGESRYHRKYGGFSGRLLAALYWVLGGGFQASRVLPDRPEGAEAGP